MLIAGLQVIDVRDRFPDIADGGRYKFPLRPVPVARISIHHHGPGARIDITPQQELETLQATYNWHRSNIPNYFWEGNGYHLELFASERIYLAGSLEKQRAAVGGRNPDMIGIALAGDFTNAIPPEGMLRAVGRLTTALCMYYRKSLEVRPHSSWGGTTCPGNLWNVWGYRCNPTFPFEAAQLAAKLSSELRGQVETADELLNKLRETA